MDGAHGLSTAAPGPGTHHGDGAGHGDVRSYVIGFVLSVLLTAAAFGLVMAGTLSTSTAVALCVGLGAVQMVVHLVYFLHMNSSSARSWNMAAFVFTVIILAILVGGSLWVMYHLNVNMMPGMMPTE